jgi:hypothetical protein
VNAHFQEQTDRIAQYQESISDVQRRQEAEAEKTRLTYELVKQQAQQAEGVSESTVNMMKSMMQDAAETQAQQLRSSMDAMESRMKEIVSQKRFAAPEAAAQKLEGIMRDTAQTLGELRADRDKLRSQQAATMKHEADVGRREATLDERDNQLKQRFAAANSDLENE